MSEFSTALNEVLSHSYNGNKASLSRASNVDASVISKLASGNLEPSMDRLEAIAKVVTPPNRKLLLLAVARDKIPAPYRDEVLAGTGELNKPPLPNDLRAILDYLEADCLRSESTREYLRRLATWIDILPKRTDLSLVAEDDEPYRGKKEINSDTAKNLVDDAASDLSFETDKEVH